MASSTILSFIISVTSQGMQNLNSLGQNLNRLQGAYFALAGVVSGVVVGALREAALQFDQGEKQAAIFYMTLGRFNEKISEADKTVDDLSKRFNVNKDVVRDSITQLLRAGYSMDQIKTNLTGAGASALAFGKSAQMGFNNFTEAAVTGLSMQLNSIGVSQNLSQAWDEMAKSLGKNVDQLTDHEKAQATTNMMLKATSMEVETLDILTGGLTATNNGATMAQQNLSKAVGEVFLPYVIKATQWVTEIINQTAEWVRHNAWLAPSIEALSNLLMGLTNILMSGVRVAINVVINSVATLGQVLGRMLSGLENSITSAGMAIEKLMAGDFEGAKKSAVDAGNTFKSVWGGMGTDIANTWKGTLDPTKQAVTGFNQVVKGATQVADIYNGKLKPVVKDVAAEKQKLWEKGNQLAKGQQDQTSAANNNAEALKKQKKAADDWQRAMDKHALDKYTESLKGMTKAELDHELALAKSTKNADKFNALMAEYKRRGEEASQATKEWASAQERLKFNAYVEGLKDYTDEQLVLALRNANAARDVDKLNAVLAEQKRRADEVAQKTQQWNDNLKQIEFDAYVEKLKKYTAEQLNAAKANAVAAQDTAKYNAVLAEQARRLQELKDLQDRLKGIQKEDSLRALIGNMGEEEVAGILAVIEEAIPNVKTNEELDALLLKKSLLLSRQQELEDAAKTVGEAVGLALAGGIQDGARGMNKPDTSVKLTADEMLANLELFGGLAGQTLEGLQKSITPDLFVDEQEWLLWQDAITAFFTNVDVVTDEAATATDMSMRKVLAAVDPVKLAFEELSDRILPNLIAGVEGAREGLEQMVQAGTVDPVDAELLLALADPDKRPSLLDSQEGRGNPNNSPSNPLDLLKLPEGLNPEDLVNDMVARGFDYIQEFKEKLEAIAPDALQSEFGKVVMEAFKRSLAGGTSQTYDAPFAAGTILPTGRDNEGLAALTKGLVEKGQLNEAYDALVQLGEEIQLFQGYMTPEIAESYQVQLTALLGVVQELGGDGGPWKYLSEVLKENAEAGKQSTEATAALEAAQKALRKAMGQETPFEGEIEVLTKLRQKYPELTLEINEMIAAYQRLGEVQTQSEQLDLDYGLNAITRDEYLGKLKAAYDAEVKTNGNTAKALEIKGKIQKIESEITKEREEQQKLDQQAIEDAERLARERLRQIVSDINEWGNALGGVFEVLQGGVDTFGSALQKLSGMGKLVGNMFGPGVGEIVGTVMNVAGGLLDSITGAGARREAQQRQNDWERRKENSGLLNLEDFTTRSQRSVGLFGLGGQVTDFNVDEQAVKFAQPIANSFENGFDQGLMSALQNADFSMMEKSIKKAVGTGIIQGMAEQFKQEVLMEILRPALKAWAAARKTAGKEDDLAAYEDLKDAMNSATAASKDFYDQVLPIAQELGVTGDGAGGAGGNRELFGAAPETVFAPVSTPIVEALDRLAAAFTRFQMPNMDGLIASIDRFDSATLRFDTSTQLFDRVIRRLESRLGGSSTAIQTGFAR